MAMHWFLLSRGQCMEAEPDFVIIKPLPCTLTKRHFAVIARSSLLICIIYLCLISPVRVNTHLYTMCMAVCYASWLTYLLHYSCDERVGLFKPTEDIFFLTVYLSIYLSVHLQPIINCILNLLVAPTFPLYLCLHHTILPQDLHLTASTAFDMNPQTASEGTRFNAELWTWTFISV